MIGLGSSGGGGSNDAGTEALFNLLAVVSNASATKTRLQQLSEKNAEVKATLEKAVAINKETDKKQEAIVAAQALLDKAQAALAAKENDLRAREDKLASNLADYKDLVAALATDKKAFAEVSSTKYAELAKRADDLAKAEKDNTLKLDKAVSEIAKTLADQKTALEAEYKSRLAAAEASLAEATKNKEATAAALAKAEEQRIFYEGRVSAIQRAIQGTP